MKHLKMLLWLLMAAFVLTACSKDDDEEKSAKWFDKNFSFELLNCDRVGNCLVADFKLTNNSGKDISGICLNGIDKQLCSSGTKTYYCELRTKKGGEWRGSFTDSYAIDLAKGESINGTIRVSDFKESEDVKMMTLGFKAYCQQLGGDERIDVTRKHAVSYNYIKTSGIQTNDRGLEYKLRSSWTSTNSSNERSCYIEFSVTNNTGYDISNLVVNTGDVWAEDIVDNLGNKYNYKSVSKAGGLFSDFRTSVTSSLANGASKSFTFKVDYLKANASTLSGELWVAYESNGNNLLEYGYINFRKIPVSTSSN